MKAFKNAIQIFSGNTFHLLLSVLISVLYARGLGPEGKGIYSSIFFVSSLLISMVDGGLRQTVTFYSARNIFEEQLLIATSIKIAVIMSLILICIGLIIFNTYYTNNFAVDLQLLALLTIPIILINSIYSGVFIGNGKLGIIANIAWIPTSINLLLVAVLFALGKLNIRWVLLICLFGSIGTQSYCLFKYYMDKKVLLGGFSTVIARNIINKGTVYSIGLFLILLNYKVDVILLKKYVDFNDIGLYTLGVSLAEILWQIPNALALVILSRSATSGINDQKWIISKTIRLSILFMVISSFLAYVLVPFILPFVYGNQFKGSIPVTRVLLAGVTVFAVFILLNSRNLGSGHPEHSIFLLLPCVILKVGMNLLLIPKFGIVGAAWSSNISYFIAAISALILFSNKEKISLRKILMYKKTDFDEFSFFMQRIKSKNS